MQLQWSPEKAIAALELGTREGLSEAGFNLARHVQERKLSGDVLDVRTGTLRRSITSNLVDQRLAVRVGTNVEYARIHEFGGIISPKTRKYLTIPIGPTRKISRTAKFQRASEIQGAFFVRRRGKSPLIAVKKGKTIQPLFVLKERVVIRARPYLRPSLYETRQSSQAIIAASIRRRVGGV